MAAACGSAFADGAIRSIDAVATNQHTFPNLDDQVRVGETVGWVSSLYARPIGSLEELVQEPFPEPLPTLTLEAEAFLHSTPDGPASTKLQPGVKLQVLAECADGWLHVTVPGCGLSRWINPEGVFGYIRTEVE